MKNEIKNKNCEKESSLYSPVSVLSFLLSTLSDLYKNKFLKETESDQSTLNPKIYYDADGTAYEWDESQQGWFPKIDDAFIAVYQLNYGQKTKRENRLESDKTINENNKVSSKRTNVSEWKELDDSVNPNVYITGLPKSITTEAFAQFMSKCGIIKENSENGQYKVKLYKNEDGTLKGDGVCTYLKPESVSLALEYLNQSEIEPGYPISVTRAKFEKKGEFIPQRKKNKIKSSQTKLLSWDEKIDSNLKSKKVASIVILKNVFDPIEFDEDPVGIQEIKEDILAEAERCGKVNKVIVYDRHEDGVVSIKFKERENADKCVKLMNWRWFGGRKIKAEIWDGVSNFKIEETEHEREARLEKWEKFINNDTKI